MIKIKELKRDQFFWYVPPQWDGEKELLRVWGEPILRTDGWSVDATCSGDYAWSLYEYHEEWLFEESYFETKFLYVETEDS